MIWRAALVRRGRALTALTAVAVAAAVTTALFTLYVDVQAKLHREFRNYGANIVVVARDGASLPADVAARIAAAAPGSTALPQAFAIARAKAGTPVVVVGTNLDQARKLNASWWSLAPFGRASAGSSVAAIIGTRAAATLASGGSAFELEFEGKPATVLPAEVLRTGGPEDSRIYVDLAAFTAWTNAPVTTYEIAAPGSPPEIAATVSRLAKALPEADARPVRQIVDAQARVLGKTRAALLGSTLLVVITAALCVLATLVTWVLDRRRDFAVMKALGASEGLLRGFFAAESAMLGALGSLAGFVIGVAAAYVIGKLNFGAAVSPRFVVLPPVLFGGVLLALLASLGPLALLRGIQPATMLKGE